MYEFTFNDVINNIVLFRHKGGARGKFVFMVGDGGPTRVPGKLKI